MTAPKLRLIKRWDDYYAKYMYELQTPLSEPPESPPPEDDFDESDSYDPER